MSGTPVQLPPDLQVDPVSVSSQARRAARPLGDRSRVAIVALGLIAVIAAVGVFTDLDQVRILNKVLNGERVTLAEAQASDDHAGTVGIIYTVGFILTTIAFLLWYGQAYRNVIAMGITRPRYGTGWAIGYWFIPIGNLFRPKQVVNDIWRGSDPDLPVPARTWQEVPVHPLLHWWWAFWLLDNFVSRYAVGRIFGERSTVSELHDQAVAYVITDFLDVITAGLAIAMIVMITRRAEERRRRYESGELEMRAGQPDPPAPNSLVAPG